MEGHNMKNQSKFIWIVLVVLFLSGVSLCHTSQNKTDDAKLANLPALIEKQMADWRVPGAAIGIVKDGKVIFLRDV